MTRPSDEEIIRMLRDAARNASSTARPASRAIPLRRAADALAAAPSLTWEERVERGKLALWKASALLMNRRAGRDYAEIALRAAFPEYAPQQED